MTSPSYRIILVRPAIAENVGLVVRAMKAFGFEQLTLVDPAFVWDVEGPVWKTACGAHEFLPQINVTSSLEHAIGECHQVIGFSRREHDFCRPRFTLDSWKKEVLTNPHSPRIALVFGPEDFGLSNTDKYLCTCLVSIPLRQETLSLNLAQAVTVVLYELSRNEEQETEESENGESFVTHADQRRLLNLLTDLLDTTSFFKTGRRERQIEILRNLILRFNLTVPEYGTCMGVLSALGKKQNKTSS